MTDRPTADGLVGMDSIGYSRINTGEIVDSESADASDDTGVAIRDGIGMVEIESNTPVLVTNDSKQSQAICKRQEDFERRLREKDEVLNDFTNHFVTSTLFKAIKLRKTVMYTVKFLVEYPFDLSALLQLYDIV
jgi:hypothetical protein